MKQTKKQQYKEQVWAALTALGYIGDVRVRHYNVMCTRIDKGDKTGLWKAQFGSKHGLTRACTQPRIAVGVHAVLGAFYSRFNNQSTRSQSGLSQ